MIWRSTLARLLASVVCAAAVFVVVTRQPGAGRPQPELETVGEIEAISARGIGFNNGYPSMIRASDGALWCVWIAAEHRNLNSWQNYAESDAIVLRRKVNGKWSEAVTVNADAAVNFAPDLAEDGEGNVYVVWSSRREGRYRLYSRRVGADLSLGSEVEILTAGELDGEPDLVADRQGRLWLVAQSWRNGSQDIVFYRLEGGGWRQMPDVAATDAPEFRPRIVAGPDGGIWCSWDAYVNGKYSVFLRRFEVAENAWGAVTKVPGDGKLDAYAPDLAIGEDGRVWVTYALNSVYEHAWGRRGPKPGGAPRPTIRLAVLDGETWQLANAPNEERGRIAIGDLPRIQVGSDGSVWVFWQTLTGHVNWKVSAAVLRGDAWYGPVTLGLDEPRAIEGPSQRTDQRPSFVIDPDGEVHIAYERGRGPFKDRDLYVRVLRIGAPDSASGVSSLSPAGAGDTESAGRPVSRAPERLVVSDGGGQRRQLYMGDLHNHLLVDDGHEGSVDQLFHIHRDRFAMDFAATTSHGDSNKLLISELAHNDALTESLLKESSFVTIPGFEWTQGDFVVPKAGHRHVIYETIGGPLYRPTEGYSDSIREFVDLMAKTNGLLFAHHITRPHTAGTDWSYVNVKVEPCVEMCSSWGRFEYYRNPGHIRGSEIKGCSVQDAWMMGLRLGVIGGSDGHNLFGDRIQGLTGVYAKELTRPALFEAIRKRHCYATTGEAIRIDFRVNGSLMGSEIKAATGPVVEGEVVGTAKLLAVEVVKYAEGVESPFPTVFRAATDGNRAKVWWRDPDFREDSLYYLRVTQEVGAGLAEKYKDTVPNPFPTEMAWSSPVWVDRE